MASISFEELGRMLSQQRGSMGIRAAAAEIEISPATLSRLERGHVPDVVTLRKICDWLEISPNDVLGFVPQKSEDEVAAQITFKNKKTLDPNTSKSLLNMIEAAHKVFEEDIQVEGH